jgi:CRP-like cAMP-binding protein
MDDTANPTLPLNLFRHETETRTLAAGEVLFKENDAGEAMYVVLEGELEISIRGKSLEKVGPGGVVGELAIIERAPRTATVTATAPSKVVALGTRRFEFLVQQTPYFATHLMRVMAYRLRRMDRLL